MNSSVASRNGSEAAVNSSSAREKGSEAQTATEERVRESASETWKLERETSANLPYALTQPRHRARRPHLLRAAHRKRSTHRRGALENEIASRRRGGQYPLMG
eukprot:3297045-Rhodomonas_salina.1